jgi:hypothetical protein
MIGIPATAAVAAGAVAKSSAYVRDTSEQSVDACMKQIDSLRKRMEKSDAQTKKLIRTLLVLTALSLGIDVSALL